MDSTRRKGIILIIVGAILVLVYIGLWVFRSQQGTLAPQEERGGLLPNPISLVLPPVVTPTAVAPDNVPDSATVSEGVFGPGVTGLSRFSRVVQEPVVAFRLFETVEPRTVTDPVSGTPTSVRSQVHTIRYVTRDEGYVVDLPIVNGILGRLQTRTNTLIQGVGRALIANNNSVLYQYGTSVHDDPVTLYGTFSVASLESVSCPVVFRTSYKIGESGSDIEYMQSLLVSSTLSTVVLSPGVYNPSLASVVKQYQVLRGITPISGVLGPKTVGKLREDCVALEKRNQLEKGQQPTKLMTTIFGTEIVAPSVSASGTKFFYFERSTLESIGKVVSNILSLDSVVSRLNYTDWSSAWVGNNRIVLTTRPSGLISGDSFMVSPLNRRMTPVVSGVLGLEVLVSPTGSSVLYSAYANDTLQLFLTSLSGGVPKSIALNTSVTKCTWSSDGIVVYCMVPGSLPTALYPDALYKHQVVTSDSLWKIITTTGYVENISDDVGGTHADQLVLDSTGKTLYWRDQVEGYVYRYLLGSDLN